MDILDNHDGFDKLIFWIIMILEFTNNSGCRNES